MSSNGGFAKTRVLWISCIYLHNAVSGFPLIQSTGLSTGESPTLGSMTVDAVSETLYDPVPQEPCSLHNSQTTRQRSWKWIVVPSLVALLVVSLILQCVGLMTGRRTVGKRRLSSEGESPCLSEGDQDGSSENESSGTEDDNDGIEEDSEAQRESGCNLGEQIKENENPRECENEPLCGVPGGQARTGGESEQGANCTGEDCENLSSSLFDGVDEQTSERKAKRKHMFQVEGSQNENPRQSGRFRRILRRMISAKQTFWPPILYVFLITFAIMMAAILIWELRSQQQNSGGSGPSVSANGNYPLHSTIQTTANNASSASGPITSTAQTAAGNVTEVANTTAINTGIPSNSSMTSVVDPGSFHTSVTQTNTTNLTEPSGN